MKWPKFVEIEVKEGPGYFDTTSEIFLNKKKWGEISVRLKETEGFKPDYDESNYIDKIRSCVQKFQFAFEEEARLSFMLERHWRSKRKRSDLYYFLSQFLPSEVVNNLDIEFNLDEDILDLIEQTGPPALSIDPVQEKIWEWLKDESTARLNKVTKSLIKWFHRKEPQHVKIKKGAPPKIILKQIGPKFIKSMKKIIGSTLKTARTLYEGGSIDTGELLEQAYKCYIASLEKKLKHEPTLIEIKEILDIHKSKTAYKERGYTSYLSKTITESPDLSKEFEIFLNSKFLKENSMHYKPNELAEFIISERLNIKPSTIQSFIYR